MFKLVSLDAWGTGKVSATENDSKTIAISHLKFAVQSLHHKLVRGTWES